MKRQQNIISYWPVDRMELDSWKTKPPELYFYLLQSFQPYCYMYTYIKVYRKDILGLLFDSWEIMSLAIVLLLVSLVLILDL